MSGIPPVVRHLLLCHSVRRNPDHPLAVDIVGVFSELRSSDDPPFPFHAPAFGVYVQVANGRGGGECLLRVRYTDTGAVVYETSRAMTFPLNPLAVRALFFSLENCVFPRPGLYSIQLRFENILLAQEPLLVR